MAAALWAGLRAALRAGQEEVGILQRASPNSSPASPGRTDPQTQPDPDPPHPHRSEDCLRHDRATCLPEDHRFHDVTHSGLDAMAVR
jgi:hypothetical protein